MYQISDTYYGSEGVDYRASVNNRFTGCLKLQVSYYGTEGVHIVLVTNI
jgi:hypothetical protein